ncbi:vitamin K-dependent gamma-carboxylase [Zerene cesonia]|uniref:vitamin K-dependent gamma-carboxylase n=1 Tax=Zerene cesonia TaxID=33412 RepID=UPI0018E5585E|nr:vitamin K-dependent gamma-carboxylase [Zerene cesonia]
MRRVNALYITAKNGAIKICARLNEALLEQFGFAIQDVTCGKIINYLYTPKDSSSLAITRILFGICMLLDIPDERGGAVMPTRWGDPKTCHFPLLPFVTAVSLPYMALVYSVLWLGALGITLGYKFRLSSWAFTICYWYLFLIEKSFWNNHSYLFGLVSLLLSCTEAGNYWSIDVFLKPSLKRTTVPYWNYFVLKYQFFILYFVAGLKKGTAEWLTGYSVPNLSEHWVFSPFKLFLTGPQINYLIVHWFIFVFDLTIAFWMMWSKTRHIAMVFCALFHLMNSRLFAIGMFPWVCLATMPLYYPFDWPKILLRRAISSTAVFFNKIIEVLRAKLVKLHDKFKTDESEIHETKLSKDSDKDKVLADKKNKLNEKECSVSNKKETSDNIIRKAKIEKIKDPKENAGECNERYEQRKMRTCLLILLHVVMQAFLPYSHFITKGYNNWTNGLYGYSWDMMVHTWDVYSVVVKVVNNENNAEYFVDPYIYTPNDRWTRHGDMVYQYAHCLKDRLLKTHTGKQISANSLSENISIYIDVWCSMNGRFIQRMFSKEDMLAVSWSPLKQLSYIMPLLDEGLNWRSYLQNMKEVVHSWNNYSDVVFIADFPGYEQDKFIPRELVNVSLTVLKGTVMYEPEHTSEMTGQSHRLNEGHQVKLDSERFHRVINIGSSPAFYMYTFANLTEANNVAPSKPLLPIYKELFRRYKNMITFAKNVFSNIFRISQCYEI